MLTRLETLKQRQHPSRSRPPREVTARAHWVKPELVGEVVHRQFARGAGHLRRTAWRGLRQDREPADILAPCARERVTAETAPPQPAERPPHGSAREPRRQLSPAAMAMVPTNLDTLRVREGLLAIMLAGRIGPRTAAWALDALSLYVSAHALEQSLVQLRRKHPDQEWVLSREEPLGRFTALPADTFPQTRRYATEPTSGTGHDRFE